MTLEEALSAGNCIATVPTPFGVAVTFSCHRGSPRTYVFPASAGDRTLDRGFI